MHIDPDYFLQADTLKLARGLLGKVLYTKMDGAETSGIIVETEAYLGTTDRASHAYNGRRTHRTETMYLPGGHAYVYLCYGMHHLFNIVTAAENVPHAILIRALEPLSGMETMLLRRKKNTPDTGLTRGPGCVSKALGIHTGLSGCRLEGTAIGLLDTGIRYPPERIAATPRIGVDYAGEDALLPYRFLLKNSPFVSERNRFPLP